MPRNKKGGPPSRRGKDKKHTHSAGRNTEELSALNSFLRNVGERAQSTVNLQRLWNWSLLTN